MFIDHKKTPSLEITVHGLEKYTNYSVRVSASTNAGEGIVSPYVQCTTLEDGEFIVLFVTLDLNLL